MLNVNLHRTLLNGQSTRAGGKVIDYLKMALILYNNNYYKKCVVFLYQVKNHSSYQTLIMVLFSLLLMRMTETYVMFYTAASAIIIGLQHYV